MGKELALLLDLDGVLVKNKKLDLFEDTLSFLSFLREKGLPFRVVSNNSRIPPGELREKLAQKGLELREDELLTALMVAPAYLRRFKSVFAFAEEAVKNYLRGEGINLKDDHDVEAVFVAQNHNLTFRDVKTATSALKLSKAKLVAVNLNKLAKDSDGLFYPATGSWVKMLAEATDYPLEEVVSLGKPSEEFFRLALKGFEDREVYFVSDDFYTDLIPAEKFGLKTVFLTTGKYSREDLERADYRPFKTFDSLTELRKYLESLLP
ncbi:MAG: HAD-IIA family hydrolase [Aquificae bacterium]|nr:HAD-IIA family hydrolase [Aquificota bacterium]